jgi:hypothetical protein
MATGLTELPPMTKVQALEYADRLDAFAEKIVMTDPYSAEINRWMAAGYREHLDRFV